MDPVKSLLDLTADYAAQFLDSLDERPVRASVSVEDLVERLGGPLPEEGIEDAHVLAELIAGAEPGVVGTQTGRYFGFVIGSALPASVAADWLTSVWDQNGFSVITSPAAAAAEAVAATWLAELLGLPAGVSSGFVTGAQGANTTALAAARQHVLAQAGWNVARDGLNGAPRIRILVGGERHVTVDRSLRLLGLGTASVELVAVDDQGRMQRRRAPRGSPGLRRAGDRLRSGRQRQHRGLGSVHGDRRGVRGRRSLAARRRRVRPVGCRQPSLRAPGRRDRSARTPGRPTRTSG